jgi:hypothetical protein
MPDITPHAPEDAAARFARLAAKARHSDRPTPRAPGRGRLIFGLDATASRQPTWDMACHLQSQMFDAVSEIGGLDVQLVYFRGSMPPKASPFVSDAKQLKKAMTGIYCMGGVTQIAGILSHVRKTNSVSPVGAFIYIGDACEESSDALIASAGTLGVPGFVFHENPDVNRHAVTGLQGIARATGGAYLPFDQNNIRAIGDLLGGVARFAVGGKALLAESKDAASRLLLTKL